mgnify:CR=1 FL=1
MNPFIDLTLDHIVPVSKGGDNDPANLVLACVDCNFGKNSKDQSEFEGFVRLVKEVYPK